MPGEGNPPTTPETVPSADDGTAATPDNPDVLADSAVPGEAGPAAVQSGTNPPAENAHPDKSAIVVTGRAPVPGDPLESVNATSFEAVQAVDKAVIAPVAHGYEKGMPKPVRSGVHNFLNNLDEPIVFLNFLLQLKPGKAIETLGRFTINSTIGIGGVMDVAKKRPFNLPRRSNGLADTLGYYGVGPGPYLFLPLIGSTTVRDMFGRLVDLAVLPTAVGKPFNQPVVGLAKGATAALDERVENDETLTRIHESDDPYLAMREYYLKKREAEIDVLKGRRASVDSPLYDSVKEKEAGEKPADATPAPGAAAPAPAAEAPAAEESTPDAAGQAEPVTPSPAIP